MKYLGFGAAALRGGLVGERFSRQAALEEAGFAVPASFVVGRQAWDEWLKTIRTELEERVFRMGSIKDDALELECGALRRWLEDQPLPGLLMVEIGKAAAELFGDSPPLVVRTSFVAATSEGHTGPIAPEPCDAFTNQSVGTLEACVRRAWSSSFSAAAMMYRDANGLDQLGGAVAVSVELMISPQRSFVLFTQNPETGYPETVIRADRADGETEHVFLDRNGVVTRRLDGDQKPNRTCEAVLTNQELSTLAAIGTKAEQLFNRAQELEGCIADGEIVLLGSRPVAVADRERVIWDNSSITETLPGITLPLTFSFARSFYREAFTDCLVRLGVNDADLEAHRHDLDHMIGYHDGRVYHRLSTLNGLFSISSLSPLYRNHLLGMFGLDTEESKATPIKAIRLGQRLQRRGQLWRGLAHMIRNHPQLESRFERFSTRFRSNLAAFERQRVSELAAPDALERLRTFTDLAFREWGITLVNDTCAALGTDLLEQLFQRWNLSASDPGLLNDLMQDEELASSRTLHHLVSLASELHASTDLFTLFETNPPDRVWQRLRRDPDHVRFFGRVKHHLHAFGHRRPDELKLESPALRNDPSPLLKLIHHYAKEGITTHELRAARQATRDSAETRLDRLTRRHPVQRRLLRIVLEITRRSIANQEEARHLRSQLFGAARQALSLIGQKLAIAGALREPSDIHYISIDELDDAIEGTLVSDDVDSVVALRRTQVALYRKRQAAPQFVTLGPIHRDLTGERPGSSTDHRRAA